MKSPYDAKLIVFSGIDGAGKSTQINQLTDFITSNGNKVKCLWSRGGYTPGFEFAKKYFRILMGKKLPPKGRTRARQKLMKKGWIVYVWLFIAQLDLLLFYCFYIRFLKWVGYTVICDRYHHDTLIDFKLNFPSMFKEKGILWTLVKLCSPKPDRSFLLLIPVKESLRRSKFKNEPFPDSEDTLNRRMSFYQGSDDFTKKYKMINCLHSIDFVKKQILNSINCESPKILTN